MATLELGDRRAVGDAVADESGSARLERDRDHGRHVAQLVSFTLARDRSADVGGDDLGLRSGDAGHVAVGVGDIAEGEDLVLAVDAQVVDADVAALVAAVLERSALQVVAVRALAEGSEPDVGDQLVAIVRGDWRSARGSRAERLAARSTRHRGAAQLESTELAPQLVTQLLVVGTREDVRRDVGDRHLLVGEERLALPGELQPGRTGADNQCAVGRQRVMRRAETGPGGGDVGPRGSWPGTDRTPVASTR